MPVFSNVVGGFGKTGMNQCQGLKEISDRRGYKGAK